MKDFSVLAAEVRLCRVNGIFGVAMLVPTRRRGVFALPVFDDIPYDQHSRRKTDEDTDYRND